MERVPEFLGEEGHERREQAQSGFERLEERGERGLRRGLIGGVSEIEAELDDFEVPVAEVTPEELVDEIGRFIESISGERER